MTGSGERMLRSTCDSAAKWTMASGRSPASRESTSACVADIAVDEAVALVALDLSQVFQVAGISEFVEIDDAQIGLTQSHADESGADKPGPASDEKFHKST